MPDKKSEEQLPLTVRFVAGLGLLFVAGWLLMFVLLTKRW